ncbi:hypothetical protein SAMN02745724_05008 [Pseudoalteromonas denitrificans DSM 6059]|uniref:Uncharacterized protein n=1 Tax=Pseudoalteromonas denitrificans DSM 6059 TaxID=1123010 RepID=A0A1I1TUS0_9GAMM|nr:hypothetical protein SAMN02745724_05008 [Pseudoalteromonas denitrificans DSM 6059]
MRNNLVTGLSLKKSSIILCSIALVIGLFFITLYDKKNEINNVTDLVSYFYSEAVFDIRIAKTVTLNENYNGYVNYTIEYSGSDKVKVEIENQITGITAIIEKDVILITAENNIDFATAKLNIILSAGHLNKIKTLNIINPHLELHHNLTKKADKNTLNNLTFSEQGEVHGVISYDRLNFEMFSINNKPHYKFNPNKPQPQACRNIVIELINSNGVIVDTTITNENGEYKFELFDVDLNDKYQIKVNAHISYVQGLNIMVKNQATADNLKAQEIYSYRSEVFDLYYTGSLDIHLTTGWNHNVQSFDIDTSFAQPFAILDTIYKSVEFLLEQNIPFYNNYPPLVINWSQQDNVASNAVANAFYQSGRYDRIFISGRSVIDENNKPLANISEWNEHTIIHEFGHYFLKRFVGRDDSQGGAHRALDVGTLELALSEGFATALAKVTLNNWIDKRVASKIGSKRIARDTMRCSIQNEVDINGAPVYQFSPYSETTITRFLLALIDPRANCSKQTTQFVDEIGMTGLYHALQNAATSEALMSIYSVAAQLKTLYPYHTAAIDYLGNELSLELNDAWGSEQGVITALTIYPEDAPLPDITYSPPFVMMDIGDTAEISFNGGIKSLSQKRPGTIRNIRFFAQQDDSVIIKVFNTQDENGDVHRYQFDVVGNGRSTKLSEHDAELGFSYIRLGFNKSQEYVIRVFGERYTDQSFNINDTISTQVSIEYIN